MKQTLKAGWKKWKAFGEWFGNIQARIALTVFYWTFMAPVGFWQTFVADCLGVRRRDGRSFWHERSTADRDLEDGRRQF